MAATLTEAGSTTSYSKASNKKAAVRASIEQKGLKEGSNYSVAILMLQVSTQRQNRLYGVAAQKILQ